MNKVWSETEYQFLRKNAYLYKDVVLAEQLAKLTGRQINLQSLRKQRQKLGLMKAQGRGKCEAKSNIIIAEGSDNTTALGVNDLSAVCS